MLLTEYNEARQMELFREDGKQEGIQIGEQRGEIKGQNLFGALVMKLISLGRNDDIERAASDPEYRARLFDELQIALN